MRIPNAKGTIHKVEEQKREVESHPPLTDPPHTQNMDNLEASTPPPEARVWNDEVSAATRNYLEINR